jgi:ADP-L-glycero-D-manno-heptose 6-epimerase
MLVVTGALGFIGSYFIGMLNKAGRKDIVGVDDFGQARKWGNINGKRFAKQVNRNDFIAWLTQNGHEVEAVFHLGARTDTTEFDWSVLEKLNLIYTQDVWKVCTLLQIPLIYASSAATYGGGELGFSDSTTLCDSLQPLNPYGRSKNEFDKWLLHEGTTTPPFWVGLKFFNVYGPNEYHKGRMASVHWHFYNQIAASGKVKLFESYREDVAHGEQKRDFIYVADVCKVLWWLFENKLTVQSDIYNLGTGQQRSYNDLAKAIFETLQLPENIDYMPMPEDIRQTYQYFTEADMTKLRSAGYKDLFFSLEAGTKDYVGRFLKTKSYY